MVRIINYVAIATLWLTVQSNAQSAVGIDLSKYTCAQFLADLEKPKTGGSVVRSMMLIAWVAGYGSGTSNKNDGNPSALRQAAEHLGKSCRKSPSSIALSLFVQH